MLTGKIKSESWFEMLARSDECKNGEWERNEENYFPIIVIS